MKALTWHGKGDMRCESVPDPRIEHPRDAIIKVTSCAICGSDLHIYDGVIPEMERGDVLGHETMGEVVEVGSDNKKLKVGDRVVVPFTISCGECFFCKRGFYSGCERSNPNHEKAEKLWGHSPAGLFGYSHLLGGYRGGQAEYLRVPYADFGPIKVSESLTDDQVLFLSDIFPTGYMAAEFCNIRPGDTIAIWGCGPVGQFAIRSAFLLGAERVIAIDTVPERLGLAASACVDKLYGLLGGRPVSALLANAGRGLGRAFLDQDFADIRRVVDTNVTGTLYLIHKVGNNMRARGNGRILITGSIAGFTPGTYQAVYNGTRRALSGNAIQSRPS
jgi:threonine dehydrogenase-like Zn-dependent dehydrogenase